MGDGAEDDPVRNPGALYYLIGAGGSVPREGIETDEGRLDLDVQPEAARRRGEHVERSDHHLGADAIPRESEETQRPPTPCELARPVLAHDRSFVAFSVMPAVAARAECPTA